MKHVLPLAFFDSKGARLRYVDQGSGPPVVLVHGILGNVENNWLETGVQPKLSQHFRVIALDLRGHGKSAKPHDRKLYGQEVVLDVIRLLDHLGIKKAHIVGYSMGGRVVGRLLTALNCPRRPTRKAHFAA